MNFVTQRRKTILTVVVNGREYSYQGVGTEYKVYSNHPVMPHYRTEIGNIGIFPNERGLPELRYRLKASPVWRLCKAFKPVDAVKVLIEEYERQNHLYLNGEKTGECGQVV